MLKRVMGELLHLHQICLMVDTAVDTAEETDVRTSTSEPDLSMVVRHHPEGIPVGVIGR